MKTQVIYWFQGVEVIEMVDAKEVGTARARQLWYWKTVDNGFSMTTEELAWLQATRKAWGYPDLYSVVEKIAYGREP